MNEQLINKLEAFRKQSGLSNLALCRLLGIYPLTYRRWKKSGNITEAYQRLITEFLSKEDPLTLQDRDAKESKASILCSDIAVIGVACYYPGASNVRELWENILARRVQFRRMLDQRLPLSEYHDEDPKSTDKTYLTKAAFLENFQFDWGRLRIPKKTVESTDIAHWLALDIALKTFEDAGYKLSEIPLQNTGVIVGNTLTGEQTRSQTLRLRWPYVQKVLNATLGHLGKGIEERSQIAFEMEKIYKSAFYPVTEDSLAGGLANTIAGRICNYLNLKGGGYIVDGACSSSLLAVATAADALKMGNMDLALAGGVDISLDPFELVGFARAGALARDQMRVYDQKANGFLPGEGCGFVLLKRLNDAIRDKNYVYAVIKGWGISSDGKGGIMEPSSSGQSFAIGRAYKDLAYKISDVDFVEGHGTGTTKGDRVELEGIATAIEKTVKKGNENKRGCGITSFKSIVGHTKAAAGVGGLIKAVLAVNQRILPPTANCTHPNDVFKDKAKNLYPLILGGRLAQDRKARAGISSAGFGGINCHITVESKDEPKQELRPKLDERALFVSQQETEVFVFTSRTAIHLKKIIQKFKEDLRNISIAEMADLAALLNKKVKPRLPIKAAIVTDSPEHLYEALVLLENEIDSFQVEEGQIYRIKAKDTATHIILGNGVNKNRIGFLYPGQGSQRLNMTRTLVHRYRWARDLFKLSELPLFEKVFLATDKFLTKEEQQEFEKQLSDTRITQPAVVLSSLIWTEFFSRLGIEPQITIGHSLGELTAFYKAGAFNKETLMKFAQFRGELMADDSRSSGSMVSLFCSKARAEELIGRNSGNIVIANINSPNQIVVSGGKKEIEKIRELAKKENIPAYPLNVSNAFHSSFMKDASVKIQSTRILPDTFKNNGIKVYSCMSGPAIDSKINLKEYFSKQVVSPVDFVTTIESASKECDLLVELGPARVLSDLVKAINEKVMCLPVESSAGNDRDLNIVLAEIFVRNVPVQWEELYKNRLIKTFVPASRKKFIENQCEHPLKIDKEIFTSKFLPVLLKVKEEADQAEEIIPGGLPDVEGKDKVAELLMALTHEITGFDRESISLNLRLLDDLNLDSIKAAELIGKAARTLGIAGQIDPSQLSNNTLGQIRDRLNELVAIAKTGPVKESVSDILKRYQDKPWVRNFVADFKPEEIHTRNVNQLKALKNIVFLAAENEEGLVKKIKQELVSKGPIASTSHGGVIARSKATKQSLKEQQIDCLIAILPKGRSNNELDKTSLKSTIEQLHEITDLANSNRLDKDSFVVFVQFGGGATAIASTLFLERPDLKVRVIDFDERTDEDKIAQKIIDELQTYESFSNVRYDHQLNRRVVSYENSYPAEYKKRDISWSGKDVVLVTGGAKGITAQCALEFARSTKVQMVLVGRSPLPSVIASEAKVLIPDTRSSSQSFSNEIIQTLKQFENEHLKCSYYSCDVTNEKDVVRVVGEIEKKVGKITGFVHGAGLNSLKRLKQASVQEAFQEALPKVMGAVNVCNALKDHPPKLIVGITSIIGLTGMEGSGWYGLANELLNQYLKSVIARSAVQRSEATKQSFEPEIVTIAYSVWDEVGMGAKLGSVNRLAEKGIGAIPVKEGIKHFRQLIEGDPGTQQVIVAARIAGIGTWKSAELKKNNFRFLEKIEYILPGVELIARANLNIEDDPYLLDHNWKGSLLFPFVFGFEAMAQAVAYVLGIEKFDHIKAKDINLQRPIPVPQDSGTIIEIHALVLPCHSRESRSSYRTLAGARNPVQVKVEIYSQETAYKEPHFTAVFEIDNTVIPAKGRIDRHSQLLAGIHNRINPQIQQIAKNVIDLDIQTDIYGPILFQGKSFQCIEQIHELYYDEKIKKGECVFTSACNQSAGEFLKKNRKFNKSFLIGDPFFIDSMLQSMQVIIPQDISLPRDIEKIELNSLKEKAGPKYLSTSNIKRLDVDHYRGDARIITHDGLFLEIKNCRLKVLDTVLSNPSANDLVNPAKRDQRIIEDKLKEISKELGFIPPIVKCAYDERLKNASKELRHKIELPLIKSAVEELLKKDGKSAKNFKIKWLKSGKPVVVGKHIKDVGASVTHKESFLIVVAGYGEQGCDVEVVNQRSLDEWMALLGNRKFKILENILKSSESRNINYFGTALWSVSEILKKSLGVDDSLLETIKKGDNVIIFKIQNEGKEYFILVFPVNHKKSLFFSLIIYGGELGAEKNSMLFKLGYKKDLFKTDMNLTGPQGQPVFIQRFPVTFKNTQDLGKNVYFSNYFDWVGEIREYGLYPIKNTLARLFETGNWGMATNSVKLHILGGLKTDDVVEARLWLHRISGSKNSVLDLMFDWLKVLSDGNLERVAISEQRVSWLKITGHGEGKIEQFPKDVEEFIEALSPRKSLLSPMPKFNESYRNFDIGKEHPVLIKMPQGHFLREELFSTSLQESNLVGNIYFSNYVKWLGKIRDNYFRELIPDYYLEKGDKGEFICLTCEVYHLTEAMPFDNIRVRMYLKKIYDNGLDLYFEFFKSSNDKVLNRLAYATHKVIFVRQEKNKSVPIGLPKNILDAIEA